MSGETVTFKKVGRDEAAARGRAVWADLVHEAYGKQVEYALRGSGIWRAYAEAARVEAAARPRRVKIRRKIRAGWNGFRYRLAKRIYDFPEDEW